MSTWTVYTTGADIGSLAMVFNAVAMLCKQTPWIWGLACVAAALSSLKGATIVPAQGAAAASKEGFGSPLVILFIAFLLTGPGLKATVQVESSRTGAVTQVANVPIVMVAIPSFGSTLAHEASGLVRTAFGATNPDYNVMSSSGNGFIDPMRRLLAARSAILRLGGINSQIQSVASACLGGDSGVDYVSVNNTVVRAGNLQAAAPDVPIMGIANTSIGLLLGQASLNTEANVYDLEPNSASMLSCSAAASKVKADIESALQSKDFARVVQVGVSGLDEADPSADHSYDAMAGQFGALRRWSTVVGNLAGGQQQANAELINLLFAETVMGTLNCLKAGDFDRANCEASMVQAVEIERANLQSAAAAMPAVATMGAFARQMLALIIGLGPLILLLAMFSGYGAWNAVRTTAQIILWPMLAVDVGAEIVNGLMLKNFSDFLATLSQSGYLSPLTTYGLYKELSLKIGVGSSIMASLPVIMGTIFGLSAVAGMRSAATAGAARGDETAKTMAPPATEAPPLVRQTSPVTAKQSVNYSNVRAEGALEALQLSSTLGTVTKDASRALNTAETRQRTKTEGKTNASEWQRAMQTGDYSKFEMSRQQGESIRKQYDNSLRVVTSARTAESAQATKDNNNNSRAGANASIGIGGGGESLFHANLGVEGSTSTGATDAKSLSESGGTSRVVDEAKALSMALSSQEANNIINSLGKEKSKTLRDSQSVAKQYSELLTKTETSTDAYTEAFKVGNSLVTAHSSIDASQMAYQMQTNTDFQRFHADRGVRRDQDPATQKYLELAQREMASDVSVTESINGSPRARDAVLRTRAAVLQFNDESASKEDRISALAFLTDGLKAMTHMSVKPDQYAALQPHDINLRDPKDETGAASPPNELNPVQAGAVRGAVPSGISRASPSSDKRKPSPARAPAGSIAPNQPLGVPQLSGADRVDAAMAAEASPLKDSAATIQAGAQGRIADAKASGLDQAGPGTVARVAANTLDNGLDINRPKNERSSTRFANDGPATPPAEQGSATPNQPRAITPPKPWEPKL